LCESLIRIASLWEMYGLSFGTLHRQWALTKKGEQSYTASLAFIFRMKCDVAPLRQVPTGLRAPLTRETSCKHIQGPNACALTTRYEPAPVSLCNTRCF
jgi:hypothetical protein